MKKLLLALLSCALFLTSCAPKISTKITKSYPTLDYREEIRIFGVQDLAPEAEELGVVKVGDSGFSVNCQWEAVVQKAKEEARKAGGNAIKIVTHKLPNAMGSSCHRIVAKILKVSDFSKIEEQVEENPLEGADYALLYVYRYGGMGALLKYDLYLGDSLICRVGNKSKETIKIKKDGLNTLWAKTEAKTEVPINIKLGREYYIRCGVKMGVMVGRPEIEVVDNQTGKMEWIAVEPKKNQKENN